MILDENLNDCSEEFISDLEDIINPPRICYYSEMVSLTLESLSERIRM